MAGDVGKDSVKFGDKYGGYPSKYDQERAKIKYKDKKKPEKKKAVKMLEDLSGDWEKTKQDRREKIKEGFVGEE